MGEEYNLDIDEIKLLSKIILLREVKVRLTSNIDRIETATTRIIGKKIGDEIKVPLWTALMLIDKGMATIPEEVLKKIMRNLWREEVQSKNSLGMIDKDIYPYIYLYIHFLKKSGEDGIRYGLDIDYIRRMINKRVDMIRRVGYIDTDILEERLTLEEIILLKKMKEVYDNWIKCVGL